MKKLMFLIAGMALVFVATTGTASADCGLCGDLTGDGAVNILDVAAFVDWYYHYPNGATPACPDAADVNCDGAVRINCYDPGYECDDLQYLINYLFKGGPAPCDPDGDGIPDCVRP